MKISKKFIFLFLAVLITTILEGKTFFLSIMYAMIILFVIEFILMKLYQAGIRVTEIYNLDKLECGAKFNVKYKILNRFILSIPNVCIKTDCEGCNNSENRFISLAPGRNETINEEVSFNHRGRYGIGEISVYIKSLFGIFEKKYKIHTSKDIEVLPNEYDIQFSFLGNKNNNSGFSGKSLMNDYDIKGIKEYKQGDSIRHINWKNTAKGNKIMVNEYNGEAGNGDYIILDMNAINYELDPQKINEEKMVDFVCSLCKYKIKKGEKMNVVINNDKIQEFEVETKDDYQSLLKYFVENESRGSIRIEDAFKSVIDSIPDDSGIVIVVNDFTGDLENELKIVTEDKRIKYKVICNKKRDLSDYGNSGLYIADLSSYVC